MENSSAAKRWWRFAFVAYGVLSLSCMAGMSIGLGIFGAATLWFIASSWKGAAKSIFAEVFWTPFFWISLCLLGASLLSLLAAMAFPVEGSQAGPMLSSLKKYHYFLFPPLFAAAFLQTSDSLERHPFWKMWAAFGAFLGIVAMAQFFGAVLFPAAWLESSFFRAVGGTNRFHGQGLMFFHLSFASCMSFVAAAAWARVIFPVWGDDRNARIFWGAAALLASLGLWFSYSRIAFVALGFVILALGFLKKPAWGLVALTIVSLGGFSVWTMSPSMQRRFSENQSGTKERVRMWKSAWAMFQDRPLTGIGFSRTGELSPWYLKNVVREPLEFTSHAHNNVLDMMAATGAIGLVCYLAWWGFLMWAALWAFRRAPAEKRWLPAAALTGFLAFHINGLTQVNFWDGKSEHTLMIWAGVVIALWVRERRIRA